MDRVWWYKQIPKVRSNCGRKVDFSNDLPCQQAPAGNRDTVVPFEVSLVKDPFARKAKASNCQNLEADQESHQARAVTFSRVPRDNLWYGGWRTETLTSLPHPRTFQMVKSQLVAWQVSLPGPRAEWGGREEDAGGQMKGIYQKDYIIVSSHIGRDCALTWISIIQIMFLPFSLIQSRNLISFIFCLFNFCLEQRR